MKHLKIASTLLIIFFVSACNSVKVQTYKELEANKHESAGIDFFQGTFQEAKLLAKKHKVGMFKSYKERLIFVDAYATWCGPCKWMSANVFTNEAAGDFFDKGFVNMKVDCEKGEGITLAREWKVSAYPTLLILSPDGEVIGRQVGAIDHNRLIQWAKDVRDKYYEKN